MYAARVRGSRTATCYSTTWSARAGSVAGTVMPGERTARVSGSASFCPLSSEMRSARYEKCRACRCSPLFLAVLAAFLATSHARPPVLLKSDVSLSRSVLLSLLHQLRFVGAIPAMLSLVTGKLNYSYSRTSSARAKSVGGTVSLRARVALRFMTNSYFVGAWTGRSAGFSPLRIRST